MTEGKSTRFKTGPSMMAWLNDYKPKRGSYVPMSRGRKSALRKGCFKPHVLPFREDHELRKR